NGSHVAVNAALTANDELNVTAISALSLGEGVAVSAGQTTLKADSILLSAGATLHGATPNAPEAGYAPSVRFTSYSPAKGITFGSTASPGEGGYLALTDTMLKTVSGAEVLIGDEFHTG